jgi:hypothetical protein
MRLLSIAACLFLTLTGVAAAQSFDTPQALLEAFYAPYIRDDVPEDNPSFRSEALQALYERDDELTPDGDLGALGFDPYVNGQDYQLSEFEVGEPLIDGDSAVVDVYFKTFGEPRSLTYELVNEDGWKIDDVVSVEGEYPYRLSEIFEEAAAAAE